MEGILRREDLADDYAYMEIKHREREGMRTEGIYQREYNRIIRMDDFEFIRFWEIKYGHMLHVISKNRYSLNNLC